MLHNFLKDHVYVHSRPSRMGRLAKQINALSPIDGGFQIWQIPKSPQDFF